MDSFKLSAEKGNRTLRIEPVAPASGSVIPEGKTNCYKIMIDDEDYSWLPAESADIEDLPADKLLGTLTIKSAKDFMFDGRGILSGEDLLFIAARLVKHPSFSAG